MNRPIVNLSLFCIFSVFNLYGAEKRPLECDEELSSSKSEPDKSLPKRPTVFSKKDRQLKSLVIDACKAGDTDTTKIKSEIYDLVYPDNVIRTIKPGQIKVAINDECGVVTEVDLLVASTVYCKNNDITRLIADGHFDYRTKELDARPVYKALFAAKHTKNKELEVFFTNHLQRYGFDPESNPYSLKTV